MKLTGHKFSPRLNEETSVFRLPRACPCRCRSENEFCASWSVRHRIVILGLYYIHGNRDHAILFCPKPILVSTISQSPQRWTSFRCFFDRPSPLFSLFLSVIGLNYQRSSQVHRPTYHPRAISGPPLLPAGACQGWYHNASVLSSLVIREGGRTWAVFTSDACVAATGRCGPTWRRQTH